MTYTNANEKPHLHTTNRLICKQNENKRAKEKLCDMICVKFNNKKKIVLLYTMSRG